MEKQKKLRAEFSENMAEITSRLIRLSEISNNLLSEEKTEKRVLTNEDEEGWYLNKDGALGLHIHGQDNHIGISSDGIWYSDATWLYNGVNGIWRKATHSEVEEALTKEAVKRGYVTNSTFKCLLNNRLCKLGGTSFDYDLDNDSFSAFSGIIDVIYKQGKWVEIVKEQPLLWVDGTKIRFDEYGATINERYFWKESLEVLLPSNPTLFQPILDKLK